MAKKPTTEVIEKPKKPLNEFQTKNFLHMIDRIQTYRMDIIDKAANAETTRLSRLLPPNDQEILKYIRSKNFKVPTEKMFIVEETAQAFVNPSTGKFDAGYTIKFALDSFPGHQSKIPLIQAVKKNTNVAKEEVLARIAGIKIKLRLGHIDSETAESTVTALMTEWNVPFTVAANANHSNTGCIR